MTIEGSRVGAILLAAGLSRRFGAADKLVALWNGRPLLDHAVASLAALPLGARIIVVGPSGRNTPANFDILTNCQPELGMGHSISLGIERMSRHPIDACLILLGDMPRVTSAHLARLLGAFEPERGVVASVPHGGRPMVPALFGRKHFTALAGLAGDRGAQILLARAIQVPIDAELLLDMDHPEDFGAQ